MMTIARIRVSALIAVCLLVSQLTGTSLGQQKEETVRLRSQLLQFDVVVTDKAGKSVTNLKKEDFQLLDERTPQDISFFSLEGPAAVKAGVASPEPASAGHPGSEGTVNSGRDVFLIFDPYFIARGDLPRLEQALIEFIDRDLLPEDQVSVISTNGELAGFQSVTRNRAALKLAIKAFLGSGADHASVEAIDSTLTGTMGDAAFVSSLPQLYKEYQLRATLQTLVRIAKAVADLPGRKIAVFVTENLPINIGTPTDPFENLFAELQDVIAASRNGGVTFYTLDPRGLTTTIPGGSAAEAVGHSALGTSSGFEDPGASADRLLTSREGLRELAAATGGFAILNHNDFEIGLKQVMEQNEAYYALAFYPSDTGKANKFHNVKILVKGHPEYTVNTRKGYMPVTAAKKEDTKHKDKQERTKEALGSLVPLQDVRVSMLQPEAARDPSGQPVARMIIQIDSKTWPFRQQGDDHLASFEIAGFAYDVHNKLVDGFSKQYNLKLQPPVYEKVMQAGINLHGEIKLKKKGLFNIRLVVTDKETGLMGTANDWVIVP